MINKSLISFDLNEKLKRKMRFMRKLRDLVVFTVANPIEQLLVTLHDNSKTQNGLQVPSDQIIMKSKTANDFCLRIF